ncbi:MAG: hypothetical protein Q4A92_08995 [Corynebacterium sp.]|nr:hypothetical protein [Corynebacterium sp.]
MRAFIGEVVNSFKTIVYRTTYGVLRCLKRVFVVFVCLCFVVFISYMEYPFSEEESKEWAAPGSVIVGFGVRNSPYDIFEQTSYSLYSVDGEKLDVARGATRFFPGAVLVDGWTALNFYGEVRILGEEPERFKASNNDTTSYDFSPRGSSGLFIFDNLSCRSGPFCHDFIHVFPGGNPHLVTLSGRMHSYALSEDETLAVLNDVPGKQDSEKETFSIFGIDHQGNVYDVAFQQEELFPDEEIAGATLHYLEDGKYLLERWREVAEGEYIDFGTVFRIDKSSNGWKLHVEGHTEPMSTTMIGVRFSTKLRNGRTGKIEKDGNVVVESLLEGTSKVTGNISDVVTDSSNVHRAFCQHHDYFYIHDKDTLHIRTWDEPTKDFRKLTLDGSECRFRIPFLKSSSCMLASVSVRDG